MSLTKYDSNIEQLIESWYQQEQQGEKYPVVFSQVWHIAGHAKKDKAERLLKSVLEEVIDFLPLRVKNPHGRPSNDYRLTCDALEQWALSAKTPEGKQIRQLYIEIRKKWRIVQEVNPEFAEQIELLKLQRDIVQAQAQAKADERHLFDRRANIFELHGLPCLAQLEGREHVEVEKTTIEVVDNISGQTSKIMSAKELIKYIYKMTGQKIKSKKQLINFLKAEGRDDLLIPVRRQSPITEDIDADKIDEAIALYCKNRQMLIGE